MCSVVTAAAENKKRIYTLGVQVEALNFNQIVNYLISVFLGKCVCETVSSARGTFIYVGNTTTIDKRFYTITVEKVAHI